jgi:hypothetical protein
MKSFMPCDDNSLANSIAVFPEYAPSVQRFLMTSVNRCAWPTAPVCAMIIFESMISIFFLVAISIIRFCAASDDVAALSAPITTPSTQRIPTIDVIAHSELKLRAAAQRPTPEHVASSGRAHKRRCYIALFCPQAFSVEHYSGFGPILHNGGGFLHGRIET